jgi:hypothetical protein
MKRLFLKIVIFEEEEIYKNSDFFKENKHTNFFQVFKLENTHYLVGEKKLCFKNASRLLRLDR